MKTGILVMIVFAIGFMWGLAVATNFYQGKIVKLIETETEVIKITTILANEIKATREYINKVVENTDNVIENDRDIIKNVDDLIEFIKGEKENAV